MGLRPTTATGAASQRPTQGTRWMRTAGPRMSRNTGISCSAPAMAQDRESHTRTVSAGGGVCPGFTTSKWW